MSIFSTSSPWRLKGTLQGTQLVLLVSLNLWGTLQALHLLLGPPYYPEVVGGTSITVGFHSDAVQSSNEDLF